MNKRHAAALLGAAMFLLLTACGPRATQPAADGEPTPESTPTATAASELPTRAAYGVGDAVRVGRGSNQVVLTLVSVTATTADVTPDLMTRRPPTGGPTAPAGREYLHIRFTVSNPGAKSVPTVTAFPLLALLDGQRRLIVPSIQHTSDARGRDGSLPAGADIEHELVYEARTKPG